MTDTEETARVLNGAAYLLDADGGKLAWTRETVNAETEAGRRVDPDSGRASRLSLYGAVERAASVLTDEAGKPVAENEQAMSGAKKSIIAASRTINGVPSIGVTELDPDFRAGEKPLDRLKSSQQENVVELLQTAGAMAERQSGGAQLPTRNELEAARAVLENARDRTSEVPELELRDRIKQAVAETNPTEDHSAVERTAIAAIVKGCHLEDGLAADEGFAREAYAEQAGGDYYSDYLEAANSDEATAIFSREAGLTETFPEAQLELIVQGTDATGFVDYSKKSEVDALDHGLADLTGQLEREDWAPDREAAPGAGRGGNQNLGAADEMALADAARSAKEPMFGEPPDLGRAAGELASTVKQMKCVRDERMGGTQGLVTLDERNTFEEVFEAFDKNDTDHPARHAVGQVRKAIKTLDNRDWDLDLGRTAVTGLENAVETIEKVVGASRETDDPSDRTPLAGDDHTPATGGTAARDEPAAVIRGAGRPVGGGVPKTPAQSADRSDLR